MAAGESGRPTALAVDGATLTVPHPHAGSRQGLELGSGFGNVVGKFLAQVDELVFGVG